MSEQSNTIISKVWGMCPLQHDGVPLKPTIFYQSGRLPEYTETKEYEELRSTEKKGTKAQPSWLMIQPDGEICVS